MVKDDGEALAFGWPSSWEVDFAVEVIRNKLNCVELEFDYDCAGDSKSRTDDISLTASSRLMSRDELHSRSIRFCASLALPCVSFLRRS